MCRHGNLSLLLDCLLLSPPNLSHCRVLSAVLQARGREKWKKTADENTEGLSYTSSKLKKRTLQERAGEIGKEWSALECMTSFSVSYYHFGAGNLNVGSLPAVSISGAF